VIQALARPQFDFQAHIFGNKKQQQKKPHTHLGKRLIAPFSVTTVVFPLFQGFFFFSDSLKTYPVTLDRNSFRLFVHSKAAIT